MQSLFAAFAETRRLTERRHDPNVIAMFEHFARSMGQFCNPAGDSIMTVYTNRLAR